MAGRRRIPGRSTHTHATHPSQEWRGTSGARTQTHTHPNTLARTGGAQPKPEPKHTHPPCTAQPAVAGYKRRAHTNTHRPQHPSQEWQGAAEARAQAHPATSHTPAMSGVVQAERTHTPTPHTPARSGGVQAERAHEHTHTPMAQSGVAKLNRNPGPRATTPTLHTPARSGRVQAERTHNHTHTPTP